MEAFGILERCALFLVVGLAIVVGYVFKWRWIYPENSSTARNIAILIIGIIISVASVVFYLYRDALNWQ